MAFFNQVMGPHVATLRSVVSYNDEQVREAMFEGMRLSQDLCYCKDWTEYKNVRLSADPFGRDAKKIAKRLYSGMTIPQNEETGVAPTPMPPGWTTDPFTIGPQWEGEPDHDED